MKQRLAYVDAAKGISILMIMMGHITSLGNPLDCWMSSMKVSIFYVISGFLLSYTGSIQKKSFGEFLYGIYRNLMLPYIYFSIIGIITKTGYLILKHEEKEKIIEKFFEFLNESLFLKGLNSMWFLPTIIFGQILFYLIVHLPKIFGGIYAVVGVFGVTIANHTVEWINNTFANSGNADIIEKCEYLINAFGKGLAATWFLGVGYLTYMVYQKIDSVALKLIFGLIFSAINLVISQINISVDFNQMDEGIYPYMFYVCGVIGSLGMILLLDVISTRVKLTFLDFWGKNSLILMCTHTVLGMKNIAYFGWQKVAYIPNKPNLEYIIECFAVLGVLLMIEYSIIVIINTKFPFLLGKRKE